MSGSYITIKREQFTAFRENTSYYLEKGSEYFSWSIQYGTHFLSESLDKIIQSLVKSLVEQKPELKEKFDIIWKRVHNTPATQEDTLTLLVKKVAFAALISLPTALIIKDFANKSNGSGLPTVFTLRGCFNHIINHYLYLHVMGSIINFIADHLKEREE